MSAPDLPVTPCSIDDLALWAADRGFTHALMSDGVIGLEDWKSRFAAHGPVDFGYDGRVIRSVAPVIEGRYRLFSYLLTPARAQYMSPRSDWEWGHVHGLAGKHLCRSLGSVLSSVGVPMARSETRCGLTAYSEIMIAWGKYLCQDCVKALEADGLHSGSFVASNPRDS